MVQATDLPRNETGIATALGILKQQFGERFHTGQSIREQHGHTTTWIKNQAPDAVVFVRSTQDVADAMKVCAEPYYTTVGCLRVPEGDLGADSYR